MFNLFCKRPQLSIVVIVYNKEKYIKECLDSILQQKIDMEIICVDDHSTDNTPAILQQYAQKHSNIKIIRNAQNSGTCFTRYAGLKECCGEYMMFIDGDDSIPPDRFATIWQYGKDKKADVVEFNALLNGEVPMWNLSSQTIVKEILKAHNDRIIKNNLWNKMFSRTTYIKALKHMNPKIKQDDFADVLYFLIHFLKNADSVAQIDVSGYNYFSNRGMTFQANNEQKIIHYCNFALTYEELCRVYGETEELFFWKNYLCNQAMDTYLTISPKERKTSYVHLKKLMTDDEIKFLISEKNKEKRLNKQ